jgi:hypothetical protein
LDKFKPCKFSTQQELDIGGAGTQALQLAFGGETPWTAATEEYTQQQELAGIKTITVS